MLDLPMIATRNFTSFILQKYAEQGGPEFFFIINIQVMSSRVESSQASLNLYYYTMLKQNKASPVLFLLVLCI